MEEIPVLFHHKLTSNGWIRLPRSLYLLEVELYYLIDSNMGNGWVFFHYSYTHKLESQRFTLFPINNCPIISELNILNATYMFRDVLFMSQGP